MMQMYFDLRWVYRIHGAALRDLESTPLKATIDM